MQTTLWAQLNITLHKNCPRFNNINGNNNKMRKFEVYNRKNRLEVKNDGISVWWEESDVGYSEKRWQRCGYWNQCTVCTRAGSVRVSMGLAHRPSFPFSLCCLGTTSSACRMKLTFVAMIDTFLAGLLIRYLLIDIWWNSIEILLLNPKYSIWCCSNAHSHCTHSVYSHSQLAIH